VSPDCYGRHVRLTDGNDGDTYVNFNTNDARSAGATSAYGNPYLFTGQRLDSESGLYYYKNRYYSTSQGRFISRDPIGYEGGINLYAYTYNSPVIHFDPDGTIFLISLDVDLNAQTIQATGKAGTGRSHTRADWTGAKITCEQCIMVVYIRLEIKLTALKDTDKAWNQRLPQYNRKWGVPRSNAIERMASIAHEYDHVFTGAYAYLSVVSALSPYDGKTYKTIPECQKSANRLETALAGFLVKARDHSKSFESAPWNDGGRYAEHPLTAKLNVSNIP